MNPFFFGSSERPLFGLFHPPKGTPRTMAALICPPLGQEYMRTHRALRQLALQLNKTGVPALRFDYSGTGDSAGVDTEASIGAWLADVASAVDELKDTAGVRTVSLVGIRLGATLAFLAGRGRADLDQLVLWDPVVRGSEYIGEVLGLGHGHRMDPGSNGAGEVGIGGFALTPAFRREIEAIDLTTGERPSVRQVVLVVSEDRPRYALLRDHLGALGTPVAYHHIPSGGDWADAERLGAALLPQAIIQGIVSSLS